MIDILDNSQLNFNQSSLLVLNLSLAVIMFGVALDLKKDDFLYVLKNPRGFVMGLFAQFLLLPGLTFLWVVFLEPPTSVALGMFLVAACPGGNISNFMTHLAKGNTALSVSLTGFSTAFSVFLTPLNFGFWAGLYPSTQSKLQEISLSVGDVFQTVALILGIPLIIGMYVGNGFPVIAKSISRILKPLSMLIFIAFVVIAFIGNYRLFLQFIGLIFLWVLGHNLLALLAGYLSARLGGLSLPDTKTLTIETGIQNSGLGLVLIFTYFNGLGGMAIIAAWWGIWHIISGMGIAMLWNRYTGKKNTLNINSQTHP